MKTNYLQITEPHKYDFNALAKQIGKTKLTNLTIEDLDRLKNIYNNLNNHISRHATIGTQTWKFHPKDIQLLIKITKNNPKLKNLHNHMKKWQNQNFIWPDQHKINQNFNWPLPPKSLPFPPPDR